MLADPSERGQEQARSIADLEEIRVASVKEAKAEVNARAEDPPDQRLVVEREGVDLVVGLERTHGWQL